MSGETKNLFNPHQGLTGRDGGPYLDEEERRLAEIRRAVVEDREPDLENAPAVAGTPLVTAGQLVAMANPTSVPSQQQADPYSQVVDNLVKDENFPVNPVSSREVTDDEKAQAEREKNGYNPADPTTVSTDEETLDENADDDDILDALTTPDEKE